MSDNGPPRVTALARAAILCCVVLLALPAIVAGGFHGPLPMSASDGAAPSSPGSANLTVVTAQGGEFGDGSDSRILLLDPAAGETRWEHSGYETYYDVDPLDASTLLYVGMLADGRTYAVEHDYQSGRHRRLFRLPFDSHDVDYLGDGEYAYLDGRNDTAVVYNRTRGAVVWEYNFREHFPTEAGNGPPADYSGDYTHLNDVVPVDGGSKFLLSPRNFDRVVLVDRERKEIEWTLGAEDNYTILNQQHNPSLISTDPPTVLVADSENDRVVEYRREDGGWEQVWEYRGGLVWPRDADRLPNGNTLIVDSYRALEVTPAGEAVWEAEIPRYLYDVERVRLGDEPGGPSMAAYGGDTDRSPDERDRAPVPLAQAGDAYADVYNTAYWALPWWLGPLEFGLALPALALLLTWLDIGVERALSRRGPILSALRPRCPVGRLHGAWNPLPRVPPACRSLFPGTAILAAGVLVVPLGIASRLFVGGPIHVAAWWNWVPPHLSVALLLSLEGTRRVLFAGDRPAPRIATLHTVVAGATVLSGAVFATLGTLSSTDLLALSDAGTFLVFGSVAVYGLFSFARYPEGARPGRDRSPLDRLPAAGLIRYGLGLATVGVSVFVLGQGLQTAVLPLSYLALAFVLLLDGDRIMARARVGGGRRRATRDVLAVVRRVVRPVWLAVAGALVVKTLGAGAMASVMADVHFLNPVTVGLALFVGSRLAGGASDRTGLGTVPLSE